MANFIDLHRIMFTQAMIDTPMDGWEPVIEDDKPVAMRHKPSGHEWALGDYDLIAKAYVGLRVK